MPYLGLNLSQVQRLLLAYDHDGAQGIFLASKARAGEFDTTFYIARAIGLLAGPVNLALLGLNMRDGFRLTRRSGRRKDR